MSGVGKKDQRIKACKWLHKIKSTEKLSNAWYRGFMSHFSEELTRSGTTIKDSKRNTRVTIFFFRICMKIFMRKW